MPITAAVSTRRIVTALAVTFYVAWGVWVGFIVTQPSDPTEDMSAYAWLWNLVIVLVYVGGGLLLVRYVRRGQAIRTAAVPVLIAPATVVALFVAIFLMGGRFW